MCHGHSKGTKDQNSDPGLIWIMYVGIYPKNSKIFIGKVICPYMLIAALFMVSERWEKNPPNFLSR